VKIDEKDARKVSAVKNELMEMLKLDYEGIANRIQHFISKEVASTKAKGVVVGLSGGLDSSVVACLSARALTPSRVLGLIMFDKRVTPKGDIEDAEHLAEMLGINVKEIDITTIHESFMAQLQADKLSEGNLRARIRMSLLYYHANLRKGLVIGTGDKSEFLIGYFTKYGDGGVDMQPIAGLYKTQVRQLAHYLQLPTRIVRKKSSPRLWEGHEAEKEIGLAYEVIDPILYCIFDKGLSSKETSKRLEIKLDVVKKVLAMHDQSKHKRELPKTPIFSLT